MQLERGGARKLTLSFSDVPTEEVEAGLVIGTGESDDLRALLCAFIAEVEVHDLRHSCTAATVSRRAKSSATTRPQLTLREADGRRYGEAKNVRDELVVRDLGRRDLGEEVVCGLVSVGDERTKCFLVRELA